MPTPSAHDAPKFGVFRRKSQVFVEIPPSPFLRKSRFMQPPKVDSQSNQHEGRRENAVPLSTKMSIHNIPADAKSGEKRKFQSDDFEAKPKKAKIPEATDEDLVACHQCRSKRTSSAILQCTSNLKTGKRCKASYCEACLKTRYGENLQAISQRKPPQSRQGHDPETTYHFTCPRCSNICNCAPCRKKQGLAPVGKFVLAKNGLSVREILEKNPQASGLLPKNVTNPIPKPSKIAEVEGSTSSGKKPKEAVDRDHKTKIKPVLEPVWRPLPQMATRQEIEDRIYLREFILRFNPILDISLKNVEELDDFTGLHDQSTKAVLIALLDLIAIEDVGHKTKIQAGVKKIRGLGLNWTKIVPILYELRNSLPDDHVLRSLPQLEQVNVELVYNTRGGKMQGLHVDQLLPVLLFLVEVASVGESVRQELEEGTKQGKEVRSAYYKAQREETERWAAERAKLIEEKRAIKENGLVGDKHVNKENGHAMDAFKAKYRDAEGKHKAIVFNIQNSYRPEMDACNSRFVSLGTDMHGRTYYALSASGPRRGKKERVPGEGERSKKWGWLISVWGKSGTTVQQDEPMDVDEDVSPDTERWWTFTEVEEMRQLSKWLTFRADTELSGEETAGVASGKITYVTTSPTTNSVATTSLGSRAPSPLPTTAVSVVEDEAAGEDRAETDVSQLPTQAGMKALARSVLEFADFVEWRMSNDERLATK